MYLQLLIFYKLKQLIIHHCCCIWNMRPGLKFRDSVLTPKLCSSCRGSLRSCSSIYKIKYASLLEVIWVTIHIYSFLQSRWLSNSSFQYELLSAMHSSGVIVFVIWPLLIRRFSRQLPTCYKPIFSTRLVTGTLTSDNWPTWLFRGL